MSHTLQYAVKTLVKEYGGVRAMGRRFNISASYISRLMNDQKVRPSNEVLETIGVERIEIYRLKGKKDGT